jgi:C-terminal processing protease CtpA/Prc
MLIDKGEIVLIADSQGVRDIYSADGNSIDKTTPLVVLVNKGTASASEVSVDRGWWERAVQDRCCCSCCW